MSSEGVEFFLRHNIENFLRERDIPLITSNDQSYAGLSPLCQSLEIDPNILRRRFHNAHGLIIKRWGRLFIRVDYIPWWLVNIHGNLKLSDESLERVEEILTTLGISFPAPA